MSGLSIYRFYFIVRDVLRTLVFVFQECSAYRIVEHLLHFLFNHILSGVCRDTTKIHLNQSVIH